MGIRSNSTTELQQQQTPHRKNTRLSLETAPQCEQNEQRPRTPRSCPHKDPTVVSARHSAEVPFWSISQRNLFKPEPSPKSARLHSSEPVLPTRSLAPDDDDSVCINNADFHLSLPGVGGFHSAHVLINADRVQRGRNKLMRSRFLDHLCELHASHMARQEHYVHSARTTQELQQFLNSDHAGENVQRGQSIKTMHLEAMVPGSATYKNILGKDFTEFGLGTSKGRDGKLYMVQLFRGQERALKKEQVLI